MATAIIANVDTLRVLIPDVSGLEHPCQRLVCGNGILGMLGVGHEDNGPLIATVSLIREGEEVVVNGEYSITAGGQQHHTYVRP